MTTILTTSIPDAIDYILSVIRRLDLKRLDGNAVVVYDGLPDQPDNPPDEFVSIGGSVQNVAQGINEWISLGGTPAVPTMDEKYAIDAYLSVYVGGSGGTDDGMSNAQKRARDQAFVHFRAIEKALRNDPKLGTVIGTGWASFAETVAMLQTAYGDDESSAGRSCTIQFAIGVYRRKYASS